MYANTSEKLDDMPDSLTEAYLNKSLAHWTILDQKRLVAFDALHSRMLEYHNNVHVKDFKRKATSEDPSTANETPHETAVVAQIFHCVDEQSLQRPYPLTTSQFSLFVQQTVVPVSEINTGCLWIHMKDLSILPQVAQKYNIHELCVAGFEDLRCHSCIIPTDGAMLIVLCTHQLEQTDLTMYKLFIYVSAGLVVTFQQEILPDVSEPDHPSFDTIVDNVLMDYKNLYSRCLKLGPMYVVYQLGQHALTLQDSAMEYLSCALTYFNRIVHLNLLHREKLDVMLKMHIIASSTILMQRSVQEVEAIFATFVSVGLGEPLHSNNSNNSISPSASMSTSNLSNNGYGLKRLLCPVLVADKHIPYLIDLSDSYIFVSACLQNIINETARLDEELDATIQIRSSNTNTILSLVATTFLPLTFLAGVFGMNFEEHGDYSIELLNLKYGPLIFSIICVVCFLFSLAYFVSQGWVEMAFFRKIFKTLTPNKVDDSHKLMSPNALRRAETEEKRREKARRFRRSQSVHPHRNHSNSLHNGHGPGHFSASSSFNSHHNPLLMANYFSDVDLTNHPRAGSSPDIPVPAVGGMRFHSPTFLQHKSGHVQQQHTEPVVRDSEESQQSIAMSGVSLGSGFLNVVPERTASDNTDERN